MLKKERLNIIGKRIIIYSRLGGGSFWRREVCKGGDGWSQKEVSLEKRHIGNTNGLDQFGSQLSFLVDLRIQNMVQSLSQRIAFDRKASDDYDH